MAGSLKTVKTAITVLAAVIAFINTVLYCYYVLGRISPHSFGLGLLTSTICFMILIAALEVGALNGVIGQMAIARNGIFQSIAFICMGLIFWVNYRKYMSDAWTAIFSFDIILFVLGGMLFIFQFV